MVVKGSPKGKTPLKLGSTPKMGTPKGPQPGLSANTPKGKKSPKLKQTPKQGPQTPKQGPQTPKQAPQTPKQAPQTPKQKPQTPKQKPQTPKQKPQTPNQKPQTPKPKSSGKKTPVAKQEPTTLVLAKKEALKAVTPVARKAQTPKTQGVKKGMKGSKTPQPAVKTPQHTPKAKQTPKSAPAAHIKRKKLEEEIDEELSDEDFEALLGNMKEKGRKNPKTNGSAAESDSEEDMDEDDEDDDEEEDEDDEDEEEDDDDEEEDDDDEEEDDDEEDRKDVPELKKAKVQAATPKLSKADAIKAEPKKANAKAAVPQLSQADQERNKRMLFIKNLPSDMTVEGVKVLSNDIQKVELRMSARTRGQNRGFAYLEFKDEVTAMKNHAVLAKSKVKEKPIFVDFVGEKSATKKSGHFVPNPAEIDPLKLFVTGFDKAMSEAEMKDIFPTCSRAELPKSSQKTNKLLGFAFVFFETPGAASKALAKTQSKVVRAKTLIVLPGKIGRKRKVAPTETQPPAKKAKKEVVKKADDDDEEGDDDEEDDDEEDDDDDEEDDDEEDDDDDEEDDDDDDDDDEEDE